MEYRILEYLMHRPRLIVSKRELLEHLYDFTWERRSLMFRSRPSPQSAKEAARGRSGNEPRELSRAWISSGTDYVSLLAGEQICENAFASAAGVAGILSVELLCAAGFAGAALFHKWEKAPCAALDVTIRGRSDTLCWVRFKTPRTPKTM